MSTSKILVDYSAHAVLCETAAYRDGCFLGVIVVLSDTTVTSAMCGKDASDVLWRVP